MPSKTIGELVVDLVLCKHQQELYLSNESYDSKMEV